MFKSSLKPIALGLTSALFLGACTTAGTKVDLDGMAEEIKWPNPETTSFNKDRGTFPNLESLKQIRSGVTKDQLYYLIGRPQFHEGFRVREWDYLFHFNTPGQGTNGVTTCQYKVLFDKNKFARSFHWRAVDPVNAVCPPETSGVVSTVTSRRYTLSADALFAFDKSDLSNMNAKGRQELDDLARELRSFDQLQSVRISGHTDYLGSDMYNMALSQRRASTVREYLIQRGVPANITFAYGAGETQPVKQCVNNGNRQELIACLQPNRRVEVEVDGSGVVGDKRIYR